MPEIIPGLEARSSTPDFNFEMIKLSHLLALAKTNWLLMTLMIVPLVFVGIAALLYRWSLKSTAIIWSPFLWMAGQISEVDDLPRFLRSVVLLSFHRLSRIYSAFVLLFFAAKMALFVVFDQIENTIKLLPGWDVLRHFVAPEDVPLWQVAGALNGVLAWVILFLAERRFIDLEKSDGRNETALKNRFKALLIGRNLLSIYTSICALIITWMIAIPLMHHLHFDRWPRFRVFPI